MSKQGKLKALIIWVIKSVIKMIVDTHNKLNNYVQ